MKSSASIAIALTLIMISLVLAAAVFFLYQGQQSLTGALQTANDDATRTLEQQQAEIELNNSAARATVTSLEALQAASSLENMDLNEQLVTSDQLMATLEAKEVQTSSDLVNAKATMEIFESKPPLVSVVEPQENTIVTVGQPLDLVVVASDNAGVDSVLFNIGGDLQGGPIEPVGVAVVQRHTWIPTDEGPITISITASNVNGILSEPHRFTLTVLPPPTSTPEPTVTPTLEPTPEN